MREVWLKLVRMIVSIAKDCGSPILARLAVCSHRADAADTVIFSGVWLEQMAPPAAKKQ